jgi:catalase
MVRFSDFAGIPIVADNHLQGASPRDFAVRFHLGEQVHTDIVGHSVDNFPACTVEGLLDFLNALIATNPVGLHPNAIEQFLGAHPSAMTFVQIPKPIPTSFARKSFFAVSAFKFTNADSITRFGRCRILPVAGNQYLGEAETATRGRDFLFDEIKERVAKGTRQVSHSRTIGRGRRPHRRCHGSLAGGSSATHFWRTQSERDREPRANIYLLRGRRRRAAEAH